MRRISILLLILFACFISAAWPQTDPQWRQHKIITFDAPGAGTGAGQGTFAWNIVPGGWISGNYIDGSGVYRGFLRAPDGTIFKFSAPGMGTGSGQGLMEVFGMTPWLEIVGDYSDSDNDYHGFVRSPRGEITTISCPGAGPGGTAFESVSITGLISAAYLDANGAWHGCIRNRDGSFINYDPPDAGIGSGQGTYPSPLTAGVSPDGTIVGEYMDSNWGVHGYIRAPNGKITEYDDPYAGSAGNFQGTYAFGINPAGDIWGTYVDADYVFHGYVRSPEGALTEIDVPNAATGYIEGTGACMPIVCFGGINPAGTVTAYLLDQNNAWHGFLRRENGAVTEFDAPGAGTGAWQGTLPASITPDGTITGYYIDKNNVAHGFVRLADDTDR